MKNANNALLFAVRKSHDSGMTKITRDDMRAAIKAPGKGGLAEVAKAIGMDPNHLSKALSGNREFRPKELLALCAHMDWSISDIEDIDARPAATQDRPAAKEPETPFTAAPAQWPQDLPVLGAAEAHNGDHLPGLFDLHGETALHFIARPPRFSGRKDVYALYVVGDSMEPRLDTGEIVLVDPRLPIRIMDDVVVQIRDDDGELCGAMIKRLVRRTASHIILHQYNPERDIEVDQSRVISLHRALRLSDVLT